MTDVTRKEIEALAEIIKGEINRMCVTKELSELDTMALHAKQNLKRLQELRYILDFRNKENEDDI